MARLKLHVFGLLTVATVFFVAAGPAFAGREAEQVSTILRNTAQYTSGVKLGMQRSGVEKLLGRKPDQNKSNRSANTDVSVWKLGSRWLSVGFDSEERVDMYSIRWIGEVDKIPAYKDILPEGFVQRTFKGTHIVEVRSKKAFIRWTRLPVPNRELVVSVLSITSRPPPGS